MFVKKYALHAGANQHHVPQGSTLLSVVEKGDGGAVYYAVVENADDLPEETIHLFAAVTGEPVEFDFSNADFVGSVRKPGSFTWHVFRLAQSVSGAGLPDALSAEA